MSEAKSLPGLVTQWVNYSETLEVALAQIQSQYEAVFGERPALPPLPPKPAAVHIASPAAINCAFVDLTESPSSSQILTSDLSFPPASTLDYLHNDMPESGGSNITMADRVKQLEKENAQLREEANSHLANTLEMCRIERFLVKQIKAVYGWVKIVAKQTNVSVEEMPALPPGLEPIPSASSDESDQDFTYIYDKVYGTRGPMHDSSNDPVQTHPEQVNPVPPERILRSMPSPVIAPENDTSGVQACNDPILTTTSDQQFAAPIHSDPDNTFDDSAIELPASFNDFLQPQNQKLLSIDNGPAVPQDVQFSNADPATNDTQSAGEALFDTSAGFVPNQALNEGQAANLFPTTDEVTDPSTSLPPITWDNNFINENNENEFNFEQELKGMSQWDNNQYLSTDSWNPCLVPEFPDLYNPVSACDIPHQFTPAPTYELPDQYIPAPTYEIPPLYTPTAPAYDMPNLFSPAPAY